MKMLHLSIMEFVQLYTRVTSIWHKLESSKEKNLNWESVSTKLRSMQASLYGILLISNW